MCRSTKGKGRQGVWKLRGDQVDESYHETVGESNRFKDKNEVTIAEQQLVHARKKGKLMQFIV